MLLSNGMLPCVTKATRVTKQSKTIIDHFITNITSLQIERGMFQIHITDRYPVFYIITCDLILSF